MDARTYKRIEPYMADLAECVADAMQQWAALGADHRKGVGNRTRASFLNDKMRDAAKKRFAGRTDVVARDKYGTTTFYFGDDLALRFKKATRSGRTKNIPTSRQQVLWTNLYEEYGLHANVGYVLDDYGDLVDIMICCATGDHVDWTLSILAARPARAEVLQGPVPNEDRPLVRADPTAVESRKKAGKAGERRRGKSDGA